MTHMSAAAAAQFAQRWLPAWTSNDPELLAEIARYRAK